MLFLNIHFKLIPITPEILTYSKNMKLINQEDLNLQDERITYLLAELNSTLDLYYEKSIDTEPGCNDH